MTELKLNFFRKHFFIIIATLVAVTAYSQEEKLAGVGSTGKETITVTDSTKGGEKKKVKVYSPRKAVISSAIFPGLGQIYNKKYWKLPIIYGAMGTSAGVFFFNLGWYKKTRYAYKVLFTKDTANWINVHPKLSRLVEGNQLETLRYYRDEYRRDIDYSALFFIILWGLNVVDAAVDAHLKAFDVSPDLSLRIKPGHSQMAGTNGISIVLAFR